MKVGPFILDTDIEHDYLDIHVGTDILKHFAACTLAAGPDDPPAATSNAEPQAAGDGLLCHATTSEAGSDATDGRINKKKAKKGQSDPQSWYKNKNKALRMQGKKYMGTRKNRVTQQTEYNVTKGPRVMGPRCCSGACKKTPKRQCTEFSEDGRQEIFDYF